MYIWHTIIYFLYAKKEKTSKLTENRKETHTN